MKTISHLHKNLTVLLYFIWFSLNTWDAICRLTCSWLKLSWYLDGDFLAPRDTRVLFGVGSVLECVSGLLSNRWKTLKRDRQQVNHREPVLTRSRPTDCSCAGGNAERRSHNSARAVHIYQKAFKHKQMLISSRSVSVVHYNSTACNRTNDDCFQTCFSIPPTLCVLNSTRQATQTHRSTDYLYTDYSC